MKSVIVNWLQLSLTDVTYAAEMRYLLLLPLILLTACNNAIYTRDGVTDGDTFYLAPRALVDNGPAFQSWVAYSLMKSACQLEIGGENPARANSFSCELRSRRRLLAAWGEKKQKNQSIEDTYLDALSDVDYAGFLAEYTSHYFGHKDWALPEGLRATEFQRWRRQHLKRHEAQTHITGSWNYKPKIDASL